MKVVAVDAGGTHVRFAVAELDEGLPRLGAVRRYRTNDFAGLAEAWQRFSAEAGEPLPPAAAIGIAAPIGEPVLRFVNSHWEIDTRTLAGDLGVERLTLLNDFGAIAHAVSVLPPEMLVPVQGPEGPLPAEGIASIVGPGTGLGVAMLIRRGGTVTIVETEGSHIGFAPLDGQEESLAARLHSRYGRVSVERVVSGPGLVEIAAVLDGQEKRDSAALWEAACAGTDPVATRALERFAMAFGSVVGDLALAHGANAVVLAGGLANRMIAQLRSPAFGDRFTAKGRYRQRMKSIPVKVATYPEPGLLGAAVAFLRAHPGA